MTALSRVVAALIWPSLLLCEVLAEEPIRGYAPPRAPRADAPAVSAMRRFTVSGMATADNVALAASSDDASRRIEQTLGFSIPFTRHELIRILTEVDASLQGGRLIKGQGWADRQLLQRLMINNPNRVDQEDILEGLCWLLLNRLVIARQDISRRTTMLGEVPDWLAVGVAQNLYPALRARNGGVISRRWMEGERISFGEILEMEYLPDGRWGEKAAAGLAVGWLLAQPRATMVFDALVQSLASGERLGIPVLVSALGGEMTPVRLEKEWDLWVAQQTQVIRRWGGVSPERLTELQEMLTIRAVELGFAVDDGIPVELSLEALIMFRREKWVLPLATLLSLRVRGLGIGEGESFREVVDAYGRFFDLIAKCVSPGLLTRLFRRVPSEKLLNKQLASARALHAALLAEVEAGKSTQNEGSDVPMQEIERFMPRAERLRLADEIRRRR